MKLIVVVPVGIAALVVSGLIYLNRPDHKYRLTIEVQTPEEVRSSSGVMAVHKGTISGPLPEVVAGVSMRVELDLATYFLHDVPKDVADEGAAHERENPRSPSVSPRTSKRGPTFGFTW